MKKNRSCDPYVISAETEDEVKEYRLYKDGDQYRAIFRGFTEAEIEVIERKLDTLMEPMGTPGLETIDITWPDQNPFDGRIQHGEVIWAVHDVSPSDTSGNINANTISDSLVGADHSVGAHAHDGNDTMYYSPTWNNWVRLRRSREHDESF